MHKQGIQKLRGCSWIEVDGIVHEFLIGDIYHTMSDDIYAKLAELAEELRIASYVPTMEYVLFDIEDKENEHFLGYHVVNMILRLSEFGRGLSEVSAEEDLTVAEEIGAKLIAEEEEVKGIKTATVTWAIT
ncbi:Pentatricopeptide repeat superfamily protein [Perilla frutescens var. hirtella]|nr:Pentatricopeptide repeat superfamily protein [Perilla frutescens var. hirtella]